MCVNFILRTVEVFDCAGNQNRRYVEAFAYSIPRIVKHIHPKAYSKHLVLAPYSIIDAKVPFGLNKSFCDCGVYAIKYIECHVLKLPLSLLDDDNIQHVQQSIAVNLWEAASDTVFIERMSKYEPPRLDYEVVDV